MSTLTDIIDRRIGEKMQGVQLAPAQVLAVQADYLRADVKLITNGTIIKGMLNKSGEKLTVGQSVKVAFQTLPSEGWITFANGEADPLGGSGGGVQVASAAILSSATVEDFAITQETMIDYSPATKVLYGAAPAFIICQENYAMMASNWTNTEKTLTVANEQYFPDAMHLTGYDIVSNVVRRYEDYFYSFIRGRTWATSGKGETAMRQLRRIVYEYPNNDPTETPTFISDTVYNFMGNSSYITIKDVGNNTTTLSNYTSDMFMVYRVTSINNNNRLNALLLPFAPESVDYYCGLSIDTAYYNNGWGWLGEDNFSNHSWGNPVYFFKNRAEQDFSMGVTQRVEPVED